MAPSINVATAVSVSMDEGLAPSSGKIGQSPVFSDIIDSASDTISNMIRAEDLESHKNKGNVTVGEEIKAGRKNGKNSSQTSKKDGRSSQNSMIVHEYESSKNSRKNSSSNKDIFESP